MAAKANLTTRFIGKPVPVKVLLSNHKAATDLLQGIRLAAQEDNVTSTDQSMTQRIKDGNNNGEKTEPVGDATEISVSEKMVCSYCKVTFTDRSHQKSHYKTDWHRYNLRQKLRGLNPVTEENFEDLVEDISSISGSDSTDSEEQEEIDKTQKFSLPEPVSNSTGDISSDSENEESFHVEGVGRRHPRVFIRNDKCQLLSIYRCVVHSKKNQPSDHQQLISMIMGLPQQTKWAVFMIAAGHFAGAIFEKGEVIAHKTFHRYTVRAKRGTTQSARDKQGNAPKSAGASLRRHNEAALSQEVSELIASWAEHLKSCDRIFLRVPSYNWAIFFGGKNPLLDKKDPRISLIPFPTRRPTFHEVKRVHEVLATIECYGEDSTIHDHINTSPSHNATCERRNASPDKTRNEPHSLKDKEQDIGNNEPGEMHSMTSLQNVNIPKVHPSEPTKKAKKKKKQEPTKERNSLPVNQAEVEPKHRETEHKFKPEESMIRNKLYTACKVGDTRLLVELLSPLLPSTLMDGHCDMNAQMTSNCDEMNVIKTEIDNEKGNHDMLSEGDVDPSSTSPSDGILTTGMLNEPFGQARRTLLHLVAEKNIADAITYLLEAGADPSIRDGQGQPPYLVSTQKSVRNQFRYFMAKYPDRYDYIGAQIPAPISSEQEAAKKAREAERRKQAKKVRKERLKEKKAEEAEREAEEREKQRYLNLSDREKRALAAERRLVSQLKTTGEASPVLSRCWQCGIDITGKVPFEYYDYKFCSPKCLKEHKISQKKT